MNVAVGARTDIGRLRDGNEDSYLADMPLFAVADGMGGHLAGDVASATAVEVIQQRRGAADGGDPETLATLVKEANHAIWNKASSDPGFRGMGTTCTLILLDESTAQIAHVGDSRAYLFRDGELKQLTEDHTLVGRMVREGRLEPGEADRHPQRSIVTRALGVDEDVEVDLLSVEVSAGDRLLLCSDGLSSMIDGSTITEVLAADRDPQAAADALVERANEAGGEDNITVVVIDVGAKSDQAPPATAHHSDVGERARTDPAADTGYHEVVAAPRARRRWPRVVLGTVLLVAVIAAGGYFAANYALDNSWFVGVDDEGIVTIYRGIPEEVAGMTLKEVHERSAIRIASLPTFKRDEVESGIKVDSLEEAEQTIADLERLATDEDFQASSFEGRA